MNSVAYDNLFSLVLRQKLLESSKLQMVPQLLNLMNSCFQLIDDEYFDSVQTQLTSNVQFCALRINFPEYFMYGGNANS